MRRLVLFCLLLTVAACGSEGPNPIFLRPSPTPAPSPQPPRLNGTYPPITGSARVFVYRDSPFARVGEYTLTSRFVLYDDGRFALQYQNPIGEYRGTYATSDGVVTLNWEGWSVAGSWGAQATLSGDVLKVRYNVIMQMTDFDDADYVRDSSVR